MDTKKEFQKLNIQDKDRIFGFNILYYLSILGGMRPLQTFKNFYILCQILLYIILILYAIFAFIFCLEEYNDLEDFMNSLILILTWSKALSKLSVFNWYRNLIDEINDKFEICYRKFGRHCEEEKKILFWNLNKFLRTFSYSYLVICYITASSWIIQMFFRTLTPDSRRKSKITIPDFTWTFHVDSYFPFVIHNRLVFWSCCFFHWINYIWCCMIMCFVIMYFIILMKYLQAHFVVLNMEIRKSRTCSKHNMKYILNNCIKYHNELFKIANEIELILGKPVLLECLAFTILLSFAAYQLMRLDGLNPTVLKIGSYLFWCIFELFILNKVANDLHVQMMNVSQSSYESNWEDDNREAKYLIKFMILRAQNSSPIKGTSFIELTNETYGTLVNSAFGYIAVLRNFDT